MTCFACAEFERNPKTGALKAGCLECTARSIAGSPAFHEAEHHGETTKYRAALDRAFKGDLKAGDSLVRRWAEKIKGVAA